MTTHPNKPAERWLTIKEFMTLYRVGQYRFRKWRDTGQIKTVTLQVPGAKTNKCMVRVLDPGWPLIDEAAKTGNPLEDVALLGANEVAAILGLTRGGVWELNKSGKLRGTRILGGHKRFSVGALRRYLAEKATGKKRPASKEVSKAMIAWAKTQLNGAPPEPPKRIWGPAIREKARWDKIRAEKSFSTERKEGENEQSTSSGLS